MARQTLFIPTWWNLQAPLAALVLELPDVYIQQRVVRGLLRREHRIAKRYLMSDDLGWYMRRWHEAIKKAEQEAQPVEADEINVDEYEVPF